MYSPLELMSLYFPVQYSVLLIQKKDNVTKLPEKWSNKFHLSTVTNCCGLNSWSWGVAMSDNASCVMTWWFVWTVAGKKWTPCSLHLDMLWPISLTQQPGQFQHHVLHCSVLPLFAEIRQVFGQEWRVNLFWTVQEVPPPLIFLSYYTFTAFMLSPLFVRHTHAQTPTHQLQNPWLLHFLML